MNTCGFFPGSNGPAANARPGARSLPHAEPRPPLPAEDDAAQQHEILRRRIRELIRDHGACFAAVSQMLGRSHSYIQQYVTRRSPKVLREMDRRKIARHFNIPEWDLLLPEERLSAMEGGDLVLIPPWRPAALRSQNTADDTRDRFVMPQPFRREWLQARFGVNPAALAVTVIAGDGMSPTLCDGDLVLIRTGNAFERDGIYLTEAGGQLRAQRMTAHPAANRVVITHDNPLYPEAVQCRPEELAIVGRIIWLSRAL